MLDTTDLKLALDEFCNDYGSGDIVIADLDAEHIYPVELFYDKQDGGRRRFAICAPIIHDYQIALSVTEDALNETERLRASGELQAHRIDALAADNADLLAALAEIKQTVALLQPATETDSLHKQRIYDLADAAIAKAGQ